MSKLDTRIAKVEQKVTAKEQIVLVKYQDNPIDIDPEELARLKADPSIEIVTVHIQFSNDEPPFKGVQEYRRDFENPPKPERPPVALLGDHRNTGRITK